MHRGKSHPLQWFEMSVAWETGMFVCHVLLESRQKAGDCKSVNFIGIWHAEESPRQDVILGGPLA